MKNMIFGNVFNYIKTKSLSIIFDGSGKNIIIGLVLLYMVATLIVAVEVF